MKDYGDGYCGRCRKSLYEEMKEFLERIGTLEELLDILHDVLKDGEQNG